MKRFADLLNIGKGSSRRSPPRKFQRVGALTLAVVALAMLFTSILVCACGRNPGAEVGNREINCLLLSYHDNLGLLPKSSDGKMLLIRTQSLNTLATGSSGSGVAQSSPDINWLELIIGAVLGVVAATTYTVAETRFSTSIVERGPIAALLRFKRNSSPAVYIGAPIHVEPTTQNLTSKKNALPVFGFGPLMALTYVTRMLIAAGIWKGRSVEVIPSSKWDMDATRSDLILLGWPRGNEATACTIGQLTIPVGWAGSDGREITENTHAGPVPVGRASYNVVDGDYITSHDFGVAISARNPWEAKRSAIIVGGSETFGVIAAAQAITVPNIPIILNMNRLMRAMWAIPIVRPFFSRWIRRREWCFVVRCEVSGLTVTPPSFVTTWTRRFGATAWSRVDR